MTENEIGKKLVDCAIRIHRDLGPGLLESVYEIILASELESAGMSVVRQAPVALEYNGNHFIEAFRADIIIEGKVIVELKAVECLNKSHQRQLFTYLKLTGLRLGYLLNFGAPFMKEGISRIINGLEDESKGIFGPGSHPK